METNIYPTNNTRLAEHFYFDRAFKIELAAFIFFAPTLFILWLLAISFFLKYGQISPQVSSSAIFFTLMYFYARMTYTTFRRNAMGKTVFVEKDRIVKRSEHGEAFVGYINITGIRHPRFPLMMNRCIVIETTAKKIFKIPLCVANAPKMIERFWRKLEENAPLLKTNDPTGFKLQFIDASKRLCIIQKLRAKYMPNLFCAVAATAFLHGTISLAFWKRGFIMMMLWSYFNMLLQVAAYFWTELFHVKNIMNDKAAGGSRVQKLLDDAGEPDPFSTYYVMAGLIALLVGMVFGIAITEPE